MYSSRFLMTIFVNVQSCDNFHFSPLFMAHSCFHRLHSALGHFDISRVLRFQVSTDMVATYFLESVFWCHHVSLFIFDQILRAYERENVPVLAEFFSVLEPNGAIHRPRR